MKHLKGSIFFRLSTAKLGYLAAGVFIAALLSCATRPDRVEKPHYEAVGLASYYSGKFHGRRTASGERYDMHDLTAAHPVLGFGSRVEVINLKNGRKVQVRVNDRGPYKKGRIIDLSYAAAKKLGMLNSGIARVRISLLDD